MMCLLKIIKFRVFPNPTVKYLHYHVFIYPTLKIIHREVRLRGAHPTSSKTRGFSLSFEREDRRGHLTGCFGEIYLSLTFLTHEVISHELNHAAMAWGRRCRFDFGVLNHSRVSLTRKVPSTEEAICYAQSSMVKEFYRRIVKMNLEVR